MDNHSPSLAEGRDSGSARRRPIAMLLALALVGALTVAVAGAVTNITPTPEQPGDVVRDANITLTETEGGLTYTRTQVIAQSIKTYAVNGNNGILNACQGDGATNNSPRSRIVVTGPTGNVVLDQTSPVKNTSVASILNGTFDQPSNPQPAPANGNYRGGPWSTSLDLTGQPAGDYEVKTIVTNKVKSTSVGAGASHTVPCTTGTPTGAPGPAAYTAGDVTTTKTFTYRPWQEKFDDYFGGGNVRFNTVPSEFTYTVDGTNGPLVKGAQGDAAMRFFALPDTSTFSLPANPLTCATNPLGCVPPEAVSCVPSNGCVARLVFIHYAVGTDQLTGLFDLDTRAFAAFAKTGGKVRVLASGGTAIDELLATTYAGIVAAAASAGIDLPTLLAKPVKLRIDESGVTHELEVSLLEGLQLTSRDTVIKPANENTLGAGLIIHIGTWSGPDLGGGKGSGYGYKVQEAGILPAIPTGLPAPANILLSGGKVRHVVGVMPPQGGQHVIALSADTSPGEPNGLPVWIPLASGATTVADSGVEFIGDDLLILSLDICLLGSCAGGGALVGTGLGLFSTSPLDSILSIGELPALWTDCTLGTATVLCPNGPIELITQIDAAIADLTPQVLGNAAVADALAALDPVIGPLLDDALAGVPGI